MNVAFDGADDYERLMGAWSRSAGEAFLSWWAPAQGAHWLEVGCGTGAFTRLVSTRCAPSSLAAVDPAPVQIAAARRRLPGVNFQAGDAMALPFAQAEFDVVASALVINFIPDRARGFAEMHRVLRPGGTMGAYLWDRSPGEDFSPHAPFEQGLRSIGAKVLQPPVVPESTPDGARSALARAGFVEISVTTFTATRTFRSFDECWDIQTMPLAPVGKSIAALGEADRARLRDMVRANLSAAADGSVTYSARALAYTARRPE
jgi:ubiquinone/menaquinone biosynthesis C-methylase UbiE